MHWTDDQPLPPMTRGERRAALVALVLALALVVLIAWGPGDHVPPIEPGFDRTTQTTEHPGS